MSHHLPNVYRPGYRPDIEGLRAIAILLVVAAHAGLPGLAGDFIGVDIFFVLSGFLITDPLAQEIEGSQETRLTAFDARRFRKLLATGRNESTRQLQIAVSVIFTAGLKNHAWHSVPFRYGCNTKVIQAPRQEHLSKTNKAFRYEP